MTIRCADLIHRLGEGLWYATACAFPQSGVAQKIQAVMKDPRPGDPVIVSFTLRQKADDLVGTLLSVADEPYPDWDEKANGEPAPTRKVWTIETLDGRHIRWENVEVRRLPTEVILPWPPTIEKIRQEIDR